MNTPTQESHELLNDSLLKARIDRIDPAVEHKFVLSGQIVTMNDVFQVIPKGTIYIDRGTIVAVSEWQKPCPAGFEGVPVVKVAGTS